MFDAQILHSHSDWALHVALSASGHSVLSTSLDGTARLRTPHGSLLLPLPEAALQCALAENDHFALALRDGTVRTYDVNGAEKKVHTFPGFRSACGAALAQNAQVQFMCFTSGVQHAVVLRNENTGAQMSKEGSGRGRGVQMADEGRRLAYVQSGNEAVVADENMQCLLTTSAHGDAGLALDGYGQHVAIADENALRVVDTRSQSVREMKGYEAPGKYGRCAISWDGRYVVAAESEGFGVWDLSGCKVKTLRTGGGGFQNGCAMSANGAQVVTAATDGKVRLWSTMGNVARFLRSRETNEECKWWLYTRSTMRVA